METNKRLIPIKLDREVSKREGINVGNARKYKMIGVVFGSFLLVFIVLLVLGRTGAKEEKIEEQEQEEHEALSNKEKVVIGEEIFYLDEDEREQAEFLEGYNLTEKEEDTLLKNRMDRVVEPFEHENRLYVFYDREKVGSEALIEVATEFIKEENIPYTIYHMNSEDGLVFGTIVLERMGYEYDYADTDGIVLVHIQDREIVTMMTANTFKEKELKR